MTEAQDQLIKEVCLKLGEHFDGFALITLVKTEEDTSDTHISYDGGFYTAVGLLEQARYDLVSRRRMMPPE